MKKIIMGLLIGLFSSMVFASPMSQIIFFGDSLSDEGNLYKIMHGYMPESPPYYKGRFSNGSTWAEDMAKHYYDKYYIGYINYAVGGATAIFHKPSIEFAAPTTLELEVGKYLLQSEGQDKGTTLFSFWIGGNDYLFDEDSDINQLTIKVTNKIADMIETLIEKGGKEFLILNLPDLSRIPFAQTNNSPERLHDLSVMHNQRLAAWMTALRKKYPNVNIILLDIYTTFNDVLNNPQKYNEQYNIHITNTTDACWNGDFSLKNTIKTGQSPALIEANRVAKAYESGSKPCVNAEEYIFWDHIHPTEVVHRVLADIAVQSVDQVIKE